MSGRVLSGYRHDLVITDKPRSSWWLVAAGLALVIIARSLGL